MSYSVTLTEEVVRKITGWDLDERSIRAILKGLDDLGASPAGRLSRGGTLENPAMDFDLIVPDPDDIDRDALFLFWIKFSVDEEALVVVGCQRLKGDTID